MFKTSKTLLIAAALFGGTTLAIANENEHGVSMYIPTYGSAVDAYAQGPKATKRNFGAEEAVLFENAKRLD